MPSWIIKQTIDLNRPMPPVRGADAPILHAGNSASHVWEVTVLQSGEAASLTGYSAAAYFERQDGVTVSVGGTISGNVVRVSLEKPVAAYAGTVKGTLDIIKSNKEITISAVSFVVQSRDIGQVIAVDPSGELITGGGEIAALMGSVESLGEVDDKIYQSIGGVETSSTASAAHDQYDLFVYEGYVYRATKDIAAGTTIVPGTNCARATITDSLNLNRVSLKYLSENCARQTALAPAEESSTASFAHASGTYFTMNGYLFEATKEVAEGDAIVVGTNCKTAALGDALASLDAELNLTRHDIDARVYADIPYVLKPNGIMSSGKWRSALFDDESHISIPISAGDSVEITANGTRAAYFAYLARDDWDNLNAAAAFADGESTRREVSANTTYSGTAPARSEYLYIAKAVHNNTYNYFPISVKINGVERLTSVLQRISGVSENLTDLDGRVTDRENAVNGQKITVIEDRDADNISINGCYYYGSSDNAQHVMPKASAGYILHFTRDANTAYQLGLKYADGSLWMRVKKAGIWGDWAKVGPADAPEEALKPRVSYESGTFLNGQATEKLTVYLPCRGHYIAYVLYHCVSEAVNCDVWRVYSAYLADTSMSLSTMLLRTGEIECAVRLDGRDDFSGGLTHGDEIETGFQLMLDGKPVASLSALSAPTAFSELRICRQSNLFDPADHVTLIAEHGCEYIFAEDGLKIRQSLLWKVSEPLANCFLAMLTPEKSVTDHFYTDVDYTPVELTESGYSIYRLNARHAVMYGEESGAFFEFDIEEYPQGLTGGDRFQVTDNGGLSYNKMYYKITNGATSAVDELWRAVTRIRIQA